MSRPIRKVAIQHLLMSIRAKDVQVIIATDSTTFITIFDCEEPNKWHITGYDDGEDGLCQTYSPDVSDQIVANDLTELGTLDTIELTLITRTNKGST